MALKLKTYEDQARFSLYLGLIGVLAALGVVAMLLRNFDRVGFYITYDPSRPWLAVLIAALFVGLVAATAGFFIGLNSAGQRRNTLSTLAWQGFFLNALVITILLSCALFFFFTRNAMTVQNRPG